MSQAKVDKYKKDKANRKKIMRREKIERMAWSIGGTIVALAIVGWVGFSVYHNSQGTSTETSYTSVNLDATQDYLNTLSAS